MSTLLLKFVARLGGADDFPGLHGPLCHRWLPKDETDALVLKTSDSNTNLKVWFKQLGFVNNDFIRFSYKRHEIDPNIIPTQGILEAGPLWGLLEFREFPEEYVIPLKTNKRGDACYEKLGKRIKNILYPPISRFIDILRTNFGQYWIPIFKDWDSRSETLGSYCSSFGMKWSLDEGNSWGDFVPNDLGATFYSGMKNHIHEYLTEDSWKELQEAIEDDYKPPFTAHLLANAHQVIDQGDLRLGFIESVNAFESAANEFIRDKLEGGDGKLLNHAFDALRILGITKKVVLVAALLGNIPKEDIENAVEVVELRNDIVHYGKRPKDDAQNKLLRFLKITATLIPGPQFRFPQLTAGNVIKPIEGWEKDKTR